MQYENEITIKNGNKKRNGKNGNKKRNGKNGNKKRNGKNKKEDKSLGNSGYIDIKNIELWEVDGLFTYIKKTPKTGYH
ncbi:hypothetical protein FACS1894152_4780 [Bacilli bacterium]|nr:hypothetical protein FACS1894152_4780 [Bacilli bacterium]